ncbi:MAG TPA: glycosyltransferase [Methylomirabilota bacterium]|jgi:glycosyltransferase involved in cell wall biosynthesis|nr:glycosyltransferase [Methylomirabilota bacterium]
MRVLMVAPTPFFGDRGCHIRILEEVRALRRLGVDTLVATYSVGRDLPDISTVRTPRVPWVQALPVGFSPHRPYLDAMLLGTTLTAARRYRPDLLHGHLHEGAAIASVVGRLVRRPVVADLQGSVAGEMIAHGHLPARGPLPAGLRQMERWILQWPARLLPSSANFARELVDVWQIPRERVVLLPDGIDPDVLRPLPAPDDLREQLGLVGKRVVVYLGVLTEYQGIDDLLAGWPRVVAAVPDAHLLLMGHPNVERYRARAAELAPPGTVTLTGRIDYGETPRYLALGDVAVSPKHVSTEANGKLLNYMAMGLPSVAYEGPVSRELLGEAGVFAPMRDVQALAAALTGLLRDPHEQKLRGQALRERAVALFGWPALGRRLVDVYRTCLEGR